MFLDRLRRFFAPEPVYAHCDIPCGIYDPHTAQMGAHTIVRMTDLLLEAGREEPSGERDVKVARYVKVREEHAEIVKREVTILWADYFTEEHLEDHPDLHTTVWETLKSVSEARRAVDKKLAETVLEKVNEIASVFWKTQGKPTKVTTAPYTTKREIVLPVTR